MFDESQTARKPQVFELGSYEAKSIKLAVKACFLRIIFIQDETKSRFILSYIYVWRDPNSKETAVFELVLKYYFNFIKKLHIIVKKE